MYKKILAVLVIIIAMYVLTGCDNGNVNEFYSDERKKADSKPVITKSAKISDTKSENGINNHEKDKEINIDLRKENYNTQNQNIFDDETDKIGDFTIPGRGIRPYAVMIDNQGTVVLPQGGLFQAQIVYEIIVEHGITRIMPIFWDTNVEMIGPVRSSRHYFLDYAYEYDSIYINYGWSPFAANDLIIKKLTFINGMTNAVNMFWDITSNPDNWQDTYTNTKKIIANIDRLGYSKKTDYEFPFKYYKKVNELRNGEKAVSIEIIYSKGYKCGYIYNNKSEKYLRTRNSKPHIERNSGKEISPKNIIILMVENITIEGDTEGRQDLATVGFGEGYYITNGRAINIIWEKKERFLKTSYYLEDGSELKLNFGQTWIQIVPLNSSINIK